MFKTKTQATALSFFYVILLQKIIHIFFFFVLVGFYCVAPEFNYWYLCMYMFIFVNLT